jgi:predicted enzyme related to lactoylglutathione lyase
MANTVLSKHLTKLEDIMGNPRLGETYLKVKDMERAISFYEAFLGIKSEVEL